MSEYGISLRISREDGAPMVAADCTELGLEMKEIVARLGLTGMCDDEPFACADAFRKNDDEGGRIYALTSSSIYGALPEDIAREHYDADLAEGERLVTELRAMHEDMVYTLGEAEW